MFKTLKLIKDIASVAIPAGKAINKWIDKKRAEKENNGK